jgi:ectoine hydroxylase-related dioxygenase (phytanoyl-CoA dioxygenase family)
MAVVRALLSSTEFLDAVIAVYHRLAPQLCGGRPRPLCDTQVASSSRPLWTVPSGRARASERKRRSKAVPVPLAAGETFVMHGWTLHKSDANLSSDRDRRILFFRYADADAVEIYNDGRPRSGRLLRGQTRFDEVRNFEADLV